MSKLLDFIERISDGSPAPLGFGAPRAVSLPGMALVGRSSRPAVGRRPRGVPDAAVSLDAVIVDGAGGGDYLKQLGGLMPGITWGSGLPALTEEAAQACRDAGADLVAFALAGTAAAAITDDDDLARLVSVAPDLSDRELRAITALPVDCLVLDMTDVSGPWTLQDLVKVGAISRRVDKHVLVEVSQAPGKKDLEALRDMGVNGLIVNLAVVGPADLAALKAALLEMPRSGSRNSSRRRERLRATLPGTGYTPPSPPAREDDDDDDDYDG